MMMIRLNLGKSCLYRTQKICSRKLCSYSSPTSHLQQSQRDESSNREDQQQHHEQVMEMGYGNGFKFIEVVRASMKMEDLQRVEELMSEMKKSGFQPNQIVYNVMINELCKQGRIRDAEKLFDEMCQGGMTANQVAYNTLIYQYCKVGELDKAFGMRERMKTENVKPSIFTFNNLIYGLFNARRLEETDLVLSDMLNHGFGPDYVTYSIMFEKHYRFGDYEASLAWYKEAKEKGVKLDSFAATMLLDGLCKEGKVDKVEEILEELVSMSTGENKRCPEIV